MPEYQIIRRYFQDTLSGLQQRSSQIMSVGTRIETPRAMIAEKRVASANQNENSTSSSLRESTDMPRYMKTKASAAKLMVLIAWTVEL